MKIKLFLLYLLVLSPLSTLAENSVPPLKIGFIGAFTGPGSIYGVASKNGIQMALREIPNGTPIEVIYENDNFEPANTVTAFKKLVGSDKVDLVITMASTPSNSVAPLAEAAKVPLLAWASDPRVSRGRNYVIRTYPSGQEEGKQAAAEIVRRKLKLGSAFYSVNDYTNSVHEGFVGALPPELLATDEEMPADTNDFKPALLRAKAKGAAFYYICLNPGQSGLFAKQLRQLGITGEIAGCENLNSWDEVKLSDNALLSSWFITLLVPEEFRQHYRAEFGDENVLSGAALHYEMIRILRGLGDRRGGEQIISYLMDADTSGGMFSGAKFVKVEGDQFFKTALRVKEVAELAVKER